MYGSNNFTTGDRCRITSNFIPNEMSAAAEYHSKAFCGSFSKDGNVFLSACQGD